MKEVTISKFRTHLHAILRQVEKTGRPIRITRFGKAIAEITPAAAVSGKIRIAGDVVLATGDPDDRDEACVAPPAIRI